MRPLLWPCGRLGRPHGLKGEIYLEPSPHGIEYLGDGEWFAVGDEGAAEPRRVGVCRVGGTDRRPLLRIDGVDSREQAAILSGLLLVAAGGSLDELPGWRVGDLIGLRAVCGERELGVVSDVLESPASDILQIGSSADVVLVPLVEELVTVDLVTGVVRVREGLLDP